MRQVPGKMIASVLFLYLSLPYVIQCAHLNASCETYLDCETPFAICSAQKICECHYLYQAIDGICRLKTLYAGLGESCSETSDCQVAYSTCENGVCACRPSFDVVDGLCQSAKFCPYKDATSQKTSVENCIITGDHSNCSKGFYCFELGGLYTPTYQEVGVCCPNVGQNKTDFRMVCPQGQIAIENATCPHPYLEMADKRHAHAHTCYITGTTQCIYEKEKYACCAKPCIHSAINIEGRCYGYVPLGGFCNHEAQCPDFGKCNPLDGSAGKYKICECPFGDHNGYCYSTNMTGVSEDEW